MGIEHDPQLEMGNVSEEFSGYEPGVELGSDGRRENDAQGRGLKALNYLSISASSIMLGITIGILFRRIWLESPFLTAIGHGLAFVWLLICQAVTLLWWFITGIEGPVKIIARAFPFGNVYTQSGLCLLPFALLILIIVLRSYSKIYVTKQRALKVLFLCLLVLVVCPLCLILIRH